MKYKKRPVEIEAVQWTGQNFNEVLLFVGANLAYETLTDSSCERFAVDLYIRTLEGNMRVSAGDYIIRGVNGEFYPCKPDIFMKTYEVVE